MSSSGSSRSSLIERLRALPERDREAFLAGLSDEDSVALYYDWEIWSRPEQRLPAGNWQVWLIMAGRGFGKTRTGAETVRQWIKDCRYVNLIGATADDARDIMVEGESGILAICPRGERPYYRPSKRRLEWPNGATSLIFTADEPDRLRGKQAGKLWCFIAGTKVTAASGDTPIEALQAGDYVRTRHGIRKVSAVGARLAEVGIVRFSNGANLIGTGEHPVLTSQGWTRLDRLSIGQFVATDTLEHTSANPERRGKGPTFTSIAGCGRRPTVPYRPVLRFTTRTATRLITTSRIWSALRISATLRFTARKEGLGGAGKRVSRESIASVRAAARRSCSVARKNLQSVFAAIRSSQTRSAQPSGNVGIVERRSDLFGASSVASVASTWVPAGSQIVYNLTVEGEHEYIANGIIVHNCDEVASWKYEESWDQAMFGLRLGTSPQAVATTTPKPTKLIRQLSKDANTYLTRGTTYDNKANLAPTFLSKIVTKYEGTRLGRQELNAELLEDNPGALWTRANIDEHRVRLMPELERIVIGVDPAASSNEDSDETGIIAAGRDKRNPPHFYVFDDGSLVATPDGWAAKAVQLYHTHKADRIIGEVNNGGEMVEAVIRHKDENVSYKAVHASRGKAIRAEPIAALYEQGRVHHVGSLPQLEDQQADWNPQVDTDSPDRMDALVWALTELSEYSTSLGLYEYYHGVNEEMMARRNRKPGAVDDEPIPQTEEVAKIDTAPATLHCPDCGSVFIQRISTGRRCGNCGKQFQLATNGHLVPQAHRFETSEGQFRK